MSSVARGSELMTFARQLASEERGYFAATRGPARETTMASVQNGSTWGCRCRGKHPIDPFWCNPSALEASTIANHFGFENTCIPTCIRTLSGGILSVLT